MHWASIIAQNEAEVQFAVGSGRLGVAYLIERDGFLFQSPIAWYPRERQWDLPPGYQTSIGHFDRPITSVLPVLPREPGRAGPRYGQPVPAADLPGPRHWLRAVPRAWRTPRHAPHVGRRPGPDYCQPRRLEPSLRDAVCEQCHLNGQWRVLRAGRQDEDFRPGLPFYRFWTVLERAGAPAEDRIVGQFEQMHESHCFRASEGRLGCISCHDPHRAPEPEEKATYFRRSLPEVPRRSGLQPAGECTARA